MYRKSMVWCIALFLLVAVASPGTPSNVPSQKDKEKIALKVALDWLKLVDNGKYPESWKGTSGLFRTAVTQDQWAQSMKGGREPLGALVSRKMKTSKYATELPGAPLGEYVVIQFETMFANRKSIIVETVTPMLDKDKEWRVSGYFIK